MEHYSMTNPFTGDDIKIRIINTEQKNKLLEENKWHVTNITNKHFPQQNLIEVNDFLLYQIGRNNNYWVLIEKGKYSNYISQVIFLGEEMNVPHIISRDGEDIYDLLSNINFTYDKKLNIVDEYSILYSVDLNIYIAMSKPFDNSKEILKISSKMEAKDALNFGIVFHSRNAVKSWLCEELEEYGYALFFCK